MAYPKPVVNLSSPKHARSKIFLPVLLLVLLLTQAASTVCGAQCVQHQLPNHTPHAMAHCHSMQQPESSGPALDPCQTGTHTVCVIDLQANTQGKAAPRLILHATVRSEAVLPHQISPHCETTTHLLRSSTNHTPLITALRL
jgi:hypothetical protein